MSNQANQKRIQNIYQMLFEMATGNFTHRISETEPDDEINDISRTLNKLAEEMVDIIHKSGYIIPVYTYQSSFQHTFILNKDFQIESFSPNVPETLGYLPNSLHKMHFAQIIGANSQDLLKQIQIDSITNEYYQNIHQLIFTVPDNGIIPYFCAFTKLLFSDKIVVSIISTILNDYILESNPTALVARPDSAPLIQELHAYILSHLDEPLPKLKELAKLLGSSEFSLKDGFKYYFNTSIYHFYNEQRLKKAFLLVQQRSYSIKSIAFMTGFNDYPTFYKAFKKRFGYAPRDLFREKEADEE